jgi:hypothetical protein
MSSLENPSNIQPESAEPKKADGKEKGISLIRPIIATLVSLVPGAFPLALLIAGMYGKGKEGGKIKRRAAAVIMTTIATGASMNGGIGVLVAAFFIGAVLAHAAWSNRSDKVTVTISSIGALVALSSIFEGHHTQMAVFGVVMAAFVLRLQQFFLWKAQKQAEGDNGEQQSNTGELPAELKSLLGNLGDFGQKAEGAWSNVLQWRTQATDAWNMLQTRLTELQAAEARKRELDQQIADREAHLQRLNQQPGQHSTLELKLRGAAQRQPGQVMPPAMPQTPPPGQQL